VRLFLLWALIICLFFLSPYVKSRLDSKELIQFRSPFYKRLVGVDNAPPKLDLSPINLVLISTLDGNLHGVDRYTGQILWSLEGAADGSLIRTYTRSTSKQQNVTRNKEENSDMVENKEEDVMNYSQQDKNYSGDQHDDSQLTKLKDDVEEDDDSDREITYIVEPTNDGILYLFSPKTGLQVDTFPRMIILLSFV